MAKEKSGKLYCSKCGASLGDEGIWKLKFLSTVFCSLNADDYCAESEAHWGLAFILQDIIDDLSRESEEDED